MVSVVQETDLEGLEEVSSAEGFAPGAGGARKVAGAQLSAPVEMELEDFEAELDSILPAEGGSGGGAAALALDAELGGGNGGGDGRGGDAESGWGEPAPLEPTETREVHQTNHWRPAGIAAMAARTWGNAWHDVEHVKVTGEGKKAQHEYVPSQARWKFIQSQVDTMGLKSSAKSAAVTAKFRGLDRVGHGFAGWQAPLIVLMRILSLLWTLCALVDTFGRGQLACNETPKRSQQAAATPRECSWVAFGDILALNQTSIYNGTALDRWLAEPVDCATALSVPGGDGSACVHPDRIWWCDFSLFFTVFSITFVTFFIIFPIILSLSPSFSLRRQLVGACVLGSLGLVLMLDGVIRRPQVRFCSLLPCFSSIFPCFCSGFPCFCSGFPYFYLVCLSFRLGFAAARRRYQGKSRGDLGDVR